MITFALLAFLLMPDGRVQELHLGEGFTAEKCDLEARRADRQLSEILSVATLIGIVCRREVGA